ncbi:MAG: Mut7-C RNAse domain-containing protein [Chloroflexi bacterium]|nr:Mut7-C RNAse domain-containing protein [Chloroflexota bacterium]
METERRFVVDVNVGRLAKWLRVMGYDTLFPREAGDNELVRIAIKEGRVLVTRDEGIARRRAVRLGQMRLVRIEDDDLRSQLKQLVRDLQLDRKSGFSRCVRCNQRLNAIAKEDVAERLPPYVRQSQCQFMECPECSRLYWRGTHWSNMVAELEQVYGETA